MPLRDIFGRKPTIDRFAEELIEHARKAGATHWTFDSHEQALLDGRNPVHRVLLANLFLEYSRARRRQRPQLIQKTLAVMTRTQVIPELWSLAATSIYPAVRSRYHSMTAEIDSRDKETRFTPMLSRPWVQDLSLNVVYDFGAHMAFVPRATVETWGVPEEEVWSRALANLRALPRPTWEPLGGGVFCMVSAAGYDETLLLVDKALESLEISTTAVFGLPNRGVCLAADSSDPAAVQGLLAQMRRSLGESPWPLSATLLERAAEGWRSFQPPPALAAGAHTLHLMDLAGIYQRQKSCLDKLHTRTQTELFVASFTLRAPKDQPDAVTSYATWSAGVDTLLPKTDNLVLVRNLRAPPAEALILPWAAVERVCGRYLEPTAEDPCRYRVRAFPDEQEWKQLQGVGT